MLAPTSFLFVVARSCLELSIIMVCPRFVFLLFAVLGRSVGSMALFLLTACRLALASAAFSHRH